MSWPFSDHFNSKRATQHPLPELQKSFPRNFLTTSQFILNVYERRHSIFDLYNYEEYPELNDHAVWLLMSKVLIDTHLGIGHTQSDLCGYLRAFSTEPISTATAQRKVLAAKKVGAFKEFEALGRRKQRMYMMSQLWIEAHLEFWNGIRADAKKPRSLK